MRAKPAASASVEVLETPQSSLLDLLDNVLTRGVMITGDVVLGIADVDLVYLRLSALLCAADRVLPNLKRGSRSPRGRK